MISDTSPAVVNPRPSGRSPAAASWRDYVSIARLDHCTKHVFIVPGMVLATILRHPPTLPPLSRMALGLLAALLIASANYVINEYLDRASDLHHPTKSQRAAVRHQLRGGVVAAEWSALLLLGLATAGMCGVGMLAVVGAFALQGIVYNVPPLRSKDLAFVDVVSESINNPLRLMIGWLIVDGATLPPSSLILAYWAGGAFLMAAKRLSEFREIVASHGRCQLVLYRKSFAHYDECSLTVACVVYALLSSFFLAVFLIKYRVEYIIVMPPLIALFGYYMATSMQPGSLAQKPEKLFRDARLAGIVVALAAAFAVATAINLPMLGFLTTQRYISIA